MNPRATQPDTTHPGGPPLAWKRRPVVVAAVLVFLFASLLYVTTLQNDFVWDDRALVENFDVRTLDRATIQRLFTTNYWDAVENQSGLYRPLTGLSLHIDYQLYGKSPAGYHLTNLLLNAVVCVFVFLALMELFGYPLLAFIAAILFAAFPMHVENVAWISGRTDVIATLFMLVSLWCYARWRNQRRAAPLAGMFVAFAAALFSKEIAVVLPAVVAVAELVPGAEPHTRRWPGWLVVVAMIAMVGLYFALRANALGSALAYFPRFASGLLPAAALSLSILAHYAYKLLFPFLLDPESDFLPPQSFVNLHTLVGLALVIGAVWLLYRWRSNRSFVFAMSVIALGLAPVLNILPLNQVMAERFLYFPSVGYALLVALLVVEGLKRWSGVTKVALIALVLACSLGTVAGARVWRDELTLFQKTVAVSGDNARARANLGNSYLELGRYDEALVQFQMATRANPSYAPAWSGLARTEGRMGRLEAALDDMNTAISLDPDNAVFYNSLGILQMQAGNAPDAAGSFLRALELKPRHMHARFNLGVALYQQGDYESAVREFTELEGKDTDFVNAYYFLAESYLRLSRPDEAAGAASHFLSLHREDDAIAARARQIVGGSE